MSNHTQSIATRVAATFAALITLAAGATAQAVQLPGAGAAHRLLRGPSLAVSICKAADGSGSTRFVIDSSTPWNQTTQVVVAGGVRYRFAVPIFSSELGFFSLHAELDVIGPSASGAYDLSARVTSLPGDMQVESLGVQLEYRDEPGIQRLIVPVFSGGEFDEPATTIPHDRPVRTFSAASTQVTCYYADDGSGLVMFATDPRGTEPKQFRFASDGPRTSASLALEFYARVVPDGDNTAETPVAIRIAPFEFDPSRTSGWFHAAKMYRAWLETEATDPGELLSRGHIEQRTDIPQWMKELDLLVSERWGFYPYNMNPNVPAPLLELRRLKQDLAADNVLVGLWFWYDRTTDLGRHGTYVPHPWTAAQAQILLPEDIHVIGYTRPGAFDLKNPLLDGFGLRGDGLEDRQGNPVLEQSGQDLYSVPYTHLMMDTSSDRLAEWHYVLGAYHALQSGMSGFYVDYPAQVGYADWKRPAGRALGVTREAWEGFARLLRKQREGANAVGRDFVSIHESAFEWLVPEAAAQGAVGTLGRTYKDDDHTRGVPFFQAIYSGYTLFWPADEAQGPGTLAAVPDAYGPIDQNNMTRLLAEGFTWGAILNSSEIALRDGKLFYEIEFSQPYHDALIHHRDTLKRLIALRDKARKWLVYGEMLADPVVGGDTHEMQVQLLIDAAHSMQTLHKWAAPCSAWKAADGSIRLVTANGGREPATVEVDLRRVGLSAAWSLHDEGSGRSFAPDATGRIEIEIGPGTGMLLVPEPAIASSEARSVATGLSASDSKDLR